MDFPLYFKNVISKRPKVFKEIDHGCFRVGPYFVKSPCTTCRLTFELWSIIVRPYSTTTRYLLFTKVVRKHGYSCFTAIFNFWLQRFLKNSSELLNNSKLSKLIFKMYFLPKFSIFLTKISFMINVGF